MVEVGILTVGRAAGELPLERAGVPVERVASEQVLPLETDLPSLLGELAPALFDGPNAGRWVHLQPPTLERTGMVWATSQVATDEPARRVYGWSRILVVAWAGEDALIPTLRSLPSSPTMTVLLGGRPPHDDPDVRRNLVVLADLCRQGRVSAILHSPDPAGVLDVALDAARNPTVLDYPRPVAVDVGKACGFGSFPIYPEPEVPLFGLVHVPLGSARQLGVLVRDLAARDALHGLLHGPPVDVDGVPVLDVETLRETLPTGDLYARYHERLLTALDSVRFEGEEPLTETIARALRPDLAEINDIIRIISAIENHRILQMRSFGAAGIHYTTQRLQAQIDEYGVETPTDAIPLLQSLILGESGGPESDPLAWRHLFAGIPAQVVPRGEPGWRAARELVQSRFHRFKASFASKVATLLERLVRRARDPHAPLPLPVLRELHVRAERVKEALDDVLTELDGRILAGCELALRQDGLLRWVAPAPLQLRERLHELVARHTSRAEAERAATVHLTRRPLGMADPDDFETYLVELVETVRTLPTSVSVIPSYDGILTGLLADCSPTALREHLTGAEGVDPVLFIRRSTSAPLLAWLERTGMRIQVRDGEPCVVYWRQAAITSRDGERSRCAFTEHRLTDLALPPLEGDDAAHLGALAQAAALVLLGVTLGLLRPRLRHGTDAIAVEGSGLPGIPLLPFDLLHQLAAQPSHRDALQRRVDRTLDRLPASSHAAESLQKLVELATLGPTGRTRMQTGLDHPRFLRLEPVLEQIFQRAARRATASALEHWRADEVRALVRPPQRHATRDLLQLAPSGPDADLA